MVTLSPPFVSGAVASFLAGLRIGPLQRHGRLRLWPLILEEEPAGSGDLEYLPLAEALGAGDIVVEELDAGGVVPNVRVRNQGLLPVLVLFGQELQGAKQNRVANASFLVPGPGDVVIDVSCVEALRWQGRRSGRSGAEGLSFHAAGPVVSHEMRRRMARRVHVARSEGRSFDADQVEVWQQVEERLASADSSSRTRDYGDVLAARREGLEEARRAFEVLPRQVGFVAMLDGAVVGTEGIGHPDVFRSCFHSLLDSYLVDALEPPDRRAAPSVGKGGIEAPRVFLEALRRARVRGGASLGLGEDLRFESREVEGCVLVAGELVHLAAAPSGIQP